jgi:hypothetical protein
MLDVRNQWFAFGYSHLFGGEASPFGERILLSEGMDQSCVIVKCSGLFYDARDNGPHENEPPCIQRSPTSPGRIE